MSLGRGSRGWIAGWLLAAAWTWTSTRLVSFQLRARADAAFWSGRFEEALRGYQRLERFGMAGMVARMGESRSYLSLLETSGEPSTATGDRDQDGASGIAALIRRQVE